MATGTVTAALYSAAFSTPVDSSDAPEEARSKAHHNKHGTGFVNPWNSWQDLNPWQIGMALIGFFTHRLFTK